MEVRNHKKGSKKSVVMRCVYIMYKLQAVAKGICKRDLQKGFAKGIVVRNPIVSTAEGVANYFKHRLTKTLTVELTCSRVLELRYNLSVCRFCGNWGFRRRM